MQSSPSRSGHLWEEMSLLARRAYYSQQIFTQQSDSSIIPHLACSYPESKARCDWLCDSRRQAAGRGEWDPKKKAHVFKGADSDWPPPRAPETHLPRPSERSHRSTSKMSVSGEQFPSPCGQGLPMRCLLSHSRAGRSDSTGSLGHSIPWCLRNPRTEGRHGWAVSLGCCRIAPVGSWLSQAW